MFRRLRQQNKIGISRNFRGLRKKPPAFNLAAKPPNNIFQRAVFIDFTKRNQRIQHFEKLN
jgi:hypothetical protein